MLEMIQLPFSCYTDIDECKNPELAAKCVENAECCNLPAHYSCKCKPGFQGDGEKQCLGMFSNGNFF